jgi:hypothetical protein
VCLRPGYQPEEAVRGPRAVAQRQPSAPPLLLIDVHLHLKLFEAHYGGADVKFTELCDALLRKNPLGPPVVYDENWGCLEETSELYNDITWFEAALGKVVMRPGIIVSGRGKGSKY